MHDNLVNPYTNSLEQSFNALMELNINTVQRLFFTSHEELMNIRHPEEFLEKTVGIMVENGQKNMEYVQDFFQIFESHMLRITLKDSKKSIKKADKDLVATGSVVTIPVKTVSRPSKEKSRSLSLQKKLQASSTTTGQRSGVKHSKTLVRSSASPSTKTGIAKTASKSRTTIKK